MFSLWAILLFLLLTFCTGWTLVNEYEKKKSIKKLNELIAEFEEFLKQRK